MVIARSIECQAACPELVKGVEGEIMVCLAETVCFEDLKSKVQGFSSGSLRYSL